MVIFASPRSGSTTLANIFVGQGFSVLYEPYNRSIESNGSRVFDGSCDFFSKYDIIKHLSGQGGDVCDRYICENYRHIVLRRKNVLENALSFCFYIMEKKKRVLNDYRILKSCYERVNYTSLFCGGKVVFFEDLLGNDGFDVVVSIFEFFDLVIRDKSVIMKDLADGIEYHNRDRERVREFFSFGVNKTFYDNLKMEFCG